MYSSFSSSSSSNFLRFPPPARRPLITIPTASPFMLRRSSRGFGVYHRKRARFKRHTNRSLILVNSSFLPPPFDGSVVPLDSILPSVAGFASGLAVFMSTKLIGKYMKKVSDRSRIVDEEVAGDWILVASPTPFNRFVLLRCSLLSFDGGEGDGVDLLESLSDRLVKEERHFVTLDRGKISLTEKDEEDNPLEYQRVCINTEDGGIVSLDWPADLDLKEERGLDTTVILIPGTSKGSLDKGVRSFVSEALRQGMFPVVMNPRGCAGSPLTTPRLFTAGDSDDVSTAMQFLAKTRPWTTLMGVGRGYGANMLTKYLAEAGERTPLTAAVCIDNPFDLEEITRTSPYRFSLDQELTGGLVEILGANKELFKGKAKAFDVEKALSSKSVRDFDKALTMVTNGFESVEDFYASCATKDVIGEVKVPVLFIQNDGAVPLYSAPRSSIAENPCTSLLLCSSSPSLIDGRTVDVSWCQDLAIEWLTAVELGLLKGRHPLLKDVDVTVNPSKGLVLSEAKAPEKGITAKKLLQVDRGKTVNGYYVDPSTETLEDSDIKPNTSFPSETDLEKNVIIDTGSNEPENGRVSTSNPVDVELVEDNMSDAEESERGQMLQTAEVVVNMLDVTMPGTLKAEDKKKVMDAVGRGETIVTALQEAVPEDVREKLTTAVTGILESSGSNLNFQKLKLPSLPPVMEKAEEARKEPSSTAGQNDSHTSSEATQKDGGSGKPQPVDSKEDDSSANEKTGESDGSEKASEAKVDNTNEGQPIGTEDLTSDDKKVDQGSVTPKGQGQEETNKNDEKEAPMGNENFSAADGSEKALDANVDSTNQGQSVDAKQSATDQNNVASAGNEGDAAQSSAPQSVEKEETDDQNKETKIMQPASDESKPAIQESNPAKLDVSQAFEALTGMDDSTQVAVNSVFGVLENMITQLDEEKKNKSEVSDEKNPKDEKIILYEKNATNEKNATDEKNDTDEKNATDEKSVTDEKNVTDKKIRSPSEDQTPNNNEAECQMPSAKSQNPGSSVHETGKGSDYDKTTWVTNEKHLDGDESVISKHKPTILPVRNTDSCENSSNNGYLTEELSEEQIAKQLDLDTTTALMLDYYPEEGNWKLLDQQPEYLSTVADNATASRDKHGNVQVHSSSVSNKENIIEPSYSTLDHEQEVKLSEMHDGVDDENDGLHKLDEGCDELEHLIKVIVSDSLNVEVQRRMNSAGMRQFESQLNRDIKRVAETISFVVVHAEPSWTFKRNGENSNNPVGKVGKLHGDAIFRAISSSVQEANFLRQVLPVGVVVGSVLAALRKYFDVSTTTDNAKRDAKRDIAMGRAQKYGNNSATKSDVPAKVSQKVEQKNSSIGEMMESGLQNITNQPVMVGAMTAALGASAMLVQHEDPQSGGVMSSSPEKESEQKDQSSGVASFAEKAMSIAGPAVPTKETGEVDQDRIVTMLADLGQRGGILRLVGKLALLWGGLRGAMSLTDKLIQFLHIDEWPLLKRVLGFVGMVLVLWSPVVIPLLPTLLQSWSTSTPSRMAELASVVGLYIAVFILIMLWGKRVRKYENPFTQYGLDFKASPKKQFQEFLKALAGGITVILVIQFVNTILGAAILSRPPYLPQPFDAMKCLKGSVQLLLVIVKGLTAATFVVFVEELLFRSWMPNEIAIDMGYHQSIIVTGLVFALFQRSLRSIPGLWLLSLGLAGARERSQGNLIVPIGLRTGMIATSFVLHTGGFLTYNPSSPVWIAGTRPLQPFSGVVGLVVSLALALSLYPRHSQENKSQKYN